MENLIKTIQKCSESIDLNKKFDYDFDETSEIFNQSEIDEFSSCNNIFEKNVKLKNILSSKYKKGFNSVELDYWIIKEWGKIQTFKINEKNNEKIEKFIDQLKIIKLTASSFETISSLSKIASFRDPSQFVIYDSRVIYVLNWFILTTENKTEFNYSYFPIPSGRNKKIKDFDLTTILHLIHNNSLNSEQKLFLDYNYAYFMYCNLIKKISKKMYNSESEIFKVEMLLFSIAEDIIENEVKKKILIKLQ